MKLRYQMRGLGIGILVTALLMGIATKEGRPLTDAEIRAKAYELGMVDGDSVRLTDFKGGTPVPQGTAVPMQKPTSEPTQMPTSEPTQMPTSEPTQMPTSEPTPVPTSEPTPVPTPVPTMIPATVPTAEPMQNPASEGGGSGEEVAIVIRPGANSYTVSVQMEEAGLIENAAVFDSYLCDNGYAGKIRTGLYQIAFGASEEQIAKIITGTD